MKAFTIIACLLLSCSSFSQENFAKQLRKLVADSSNMFRSFKKDFKETSFYPQDTIWSTNMQLEGTMQNEMETNDTSSVYSAMLADSIKSKKGEVLCDEWKDKIALVFPSATVRKYKVVDYNPSRYGWLIDKGGILISIHMIQLRGGKDNMIWLNIHYFNPAILNNHQSPIDR